MEQPNYNNLIASNLEEMAKQPGKNAFQKKHYREAAKKIRSHPNPITSGAQAKREIGTGIGDSIMTKIDEILSTGTLQVLDQRPPEEKERTRIVELFKTIHEVGEAAAQKWYNWGARSFEDIAQIYNSHMTYEQQLGYRYYNDFNLKIPRQEIDWVNEYLGSLLNPLGIKYVIAGSYRRGVAQSGDIDMLVENTTNNLTLDQVLLPIRQSGMIVADLAGGARENVVYRGLINTPPGMFYTAPPVRRFDIKLISKENWAYALLHYTGSGNFNEKLRRIPKAMGLTLSENGLVEKASDRHYAAATEAEIFALLGVKYLAPHERTETVEITLTEQGPTVQQLQMSTVPIMQAAFGHLLTGNSNNPPPVVEIKHTGQWSIVTQTLLMYVTDKMIFTQQLACFDLDQTIIDSKSGEYPKGADDVLLMPNRKSKLQKLLQDGYTLVIFTNQSCRTAKEQNHKYQRISYALQLLNLPVLLFMATGKDNYRKPEIGMWQVCRNYLPVVTNSFYCGNEAGRSTDRNDSDLMFAKNAGLPFYIPEQIFN